jgi:predicted RNA-binding protein with PIN domain
VTVTAVNLNDYSAADPIDFYWFDWNYFYLDGKESSSNCFIDICPTETEDTEQEMIGKRKILDKTLMHRLDWKTDWNHTDFAVVVETADAGDQKAWFGFGSVWKSQSQSIHPGFICYALLPYGRNRME